jgi:hypothetical protein
MPPLPERCLELAEEVQRLEDERAALSAEWIGAGPAEKPRIASAIVRATQQLWEAQDRLDECVGRAPTMSTVWDATIGVSSAHPDFRTLNAPAVSLAVPLTFTGEANERVGAGWPSWTVAGALTLVGPVRVGDTVTVTLQGVTPGTFDRASGAMALSVVFGFTHSLPVPLSWFRGFPSTLSVLLTTGVVGNPIPPGVPLRGRPLDATSLLGLVASGTAAGGEFGGFGMAVSMIGPVAPPLPL